MRSAPASFHAAAQVALGRVLLGKVVALLDPLGIEVAPLKGIVLDALGRRDRGPRPMLDVDVLVDPRSGERALDALRAAGFEVRARSPTAATLHDPTLRTDLDLHFEVFPDGLFALKARDVLSRSTLDERLLSTRVRLLDPYDQYGHLVGHFARSRCTSADQRRIGDFRVVSSAYGLDARRTAAHLEAHGLARAARYALRHPSASGDGFASEVIARLRPDPVGMLAVRLASPIADAYPGNDPRSAGVPHLVNLSVAAGARSFINHALESLRRRF